MRFLQCCVDIRKCPLGSDQNLDQTAVTGVLELEETLFLLVNEMQTDFRLELIEG